MGQNVEKAGNNHISLYIPFPNMFTLMPSVAHPSIFTLPDRLVAYLVWQQQLNAISQQHRSW